jgi:pimeloyl-ACP methyl ester carboxylesterase
MQSGFADSESFWRLLFWGILADVPIGLGAVRCPVILAQGTADLISSLQTPRYLAVVPGSTFRPLLAAGHAPQSDSPAAIIALVRQASSRATTGART